MANFAYIKNGVVINILVAEQEVIDTGLFGNPTDFVEYNESNPAYINGMYDSVEKAFYPIQPFSSWIKDTVNHTWQPPTPKPTDGKVYTWDEPTKTWVLIS